MKLEFEVNGEARALEVEPLRRLLDVLREDLGLTGTKEGCGEGECGACTVLVDGVAVNSCLVPACQTTGARVETIEGRGFEAVQQAFLDEGGAQCGICTPGMIVMTRAWLEECAARGVQPDEQGARVALAGNLCRCTGYGAIVRSAIVRRQSNLSHAADAPGSPVALRGVRQIALAPYDRGTEALRSVLEQLATADDTTRVIAGGTDLMVELRTGRTKAARVIDIRALDELRGLREESSGLRIGALETCADLRRSPLVRERFDVLSQACAEVGAEQIQARATLGGNLGTASPAADLTPVLLALDARVRLISLAGARELALDEFLVGYRRTARRVDELIESIFVPWLASGTRCAFRKVGTRRAQSISKLVVALALRVDAGKLVHVRASAGAVAPRTLRLRALERELDGRAPTPEVLRRAARAAALEDATPIDDVRSTASYRRHALARTLVTLLAELTTVRA
ncbi:MAG: FAD binding domain-containing protein [Planctomycetes bacterium]|nr:FAD binding domain-containing protein [Planctomycetota bacterium]